MTEFSDRVVSEENDKILPMAAIYGDEEEKFEEWFTEKDEQGISKLYFLADFVDESGAGTRKDESYEKNYLIGKYGAIPALKSIDIFKEE